MIAVRDFVRRHPRPSLLLVFFTFGQAVAFVPVVASRASDVELDAEWILIIPTILFLLLPALVITRITDGRDGLRRLLARVVAFRVPLRWYLLPLVVMPLVVLLGNGIVDPGGVAPAYLMGFLPALAFQFVTTNWWEETVWTGFFQAPLQDRYGPMRALLMTVPFFALEHVSLVFGGTVAQGVVQFALITLVIVPARALFAWVYNRTGSLALTGLVHAAGNAAGLGLIARITHHPGDSGIGLLALGLIVLIATRGRLGLTGSFERQRYGVSDARTAVRGEGGS